MLIPPTASILIATQPVDFRQSINGLAAFVELHLHERPLSGHLFVFTNRRRNALKILFWHHGGFFLLYKRLERGTFYLPSSDTDRSNLSQAELLAILEGIDLSTGRRLPRWSPPSRSVTS